MKPVYRERLEQYEGPSKPLVVEVPALLFKEFEIYATREGDIVEDLVHEGMLRVIDVRRNDRKYLRSWPYSQG